MVLFKVKEVRTILRPIRKFYQLIFDKPFHKKEIIAYRYKILRNIGTGSYGLVYQCLDLITKEIKVLKQLRPSRSRFKNEVKLFEQEIAVMRHLNHKNMPTLYDAFSINRDFFYVMNYIEGENLEKQIFEHNKMFDEKHSLLFLERLLELVHVLHQKNIYHLDLRIPNIILNNDEVKLIDFGLAKMANTEDPTGNFTKNDIEAMKQQDYYDLGDILLYLLYTTYTAKNKKALPWTEELSLEKETVHLLKRLLTLKESYRNTNEISIDLKAAIQATEK